MSDFNNIHTPVLLDQCVRLVTPALEHPGAVVVDCTLGLAGHATAFLKAAPQARLIGIDRDEEALAMASERMKEEGLDARFTPVHAAFDEFGDVLDDLELERVDAAFMDLGLSSLQIDETDRGFSYSHDAPLDMRMDTSQASTPRRFSRNTAKASWCGFSASMARNASLSRSPVPSSCQREKEPLKTSRQLDVLVDQLYPSPTARKATLPNASSRPCASKSTANSTNSSARCRNRQQARPLWQAGRRVLPFARRPHGQNVHGPRP